MKLDTPTLFLCLMIAEFAGSAILLLFLLIWKGRTRACAQSLALWAAGMFCIGSGTVLIGMRGAISNELSIHLANALIIFGVGLSGSAFAAFLGRRRFIWVFVALSGLWVLLCFYQPFWDSLLARLHYVQACIAMSYLWIIWLAVRANGERLHSARLLGLTSLIGFAGAVWIVLHHDSAHFPTFLSSFSQDFMSVYLITMMFSFIMTIVLPPAMVIERSLLRFREQAYQDALTALPNRRAFLNDAEAWIESRKSRQDTYSLIMFDMDQFKAVNDRFSRAMGDALLQLFGRVLKDMLGETAVPGRVGGEEFTVFLPDSDKEQALLTSQRICRRFALECQEASDGKLMISVSVGLVTANSTVSLERAMEAVGRGLHKAKKQGRAQIVTMDLSPSGILKKAKKQGGFSSVRKKAA